MKLKSFGCSFIFGSDLADANYTPPCPKSSRSTWPALLAQQLGYDYQCYARPGSGNLQIAERVLNELTDAEQDLIVVNWTWIDRFDYIIKNDNSWQNWQTIMPTDNNQVSELYYKEIQSDYRDKLTTLMSIRLVIDMLKQKQVAFIMTYMDELLFDQRWHTSPAVIDLQEYVKPYMTTFEGQTFLEWSRRHNYPESDTWHPLEAAHRAAGDYMIKVFDTKNIIDR
jgi:hypothetical protein